MSEPNWFTGDVAGEDPRIAAARTAASPMSPFLTTLITALNTQQQYKNKRQGAVIGGTLGFLQGLLAASNRDTAATLTSKDIAAQEAFTSSLGDRMAGEADWMKQNGTPLDNERVQLRAQAFTSLVKLMQSPDPQVRQQALQQIGQIQQQDAAHFSEIDRNTEQQRQERYALRVKQGDEYKAQFNALQNEQRQKEADFREVASILADPKADIQSKRAAYFKYAQSSPADAQGNVPHLSAAPLGVGISFDLLKDLTPEQMLAAANDAYTARVGVIPTRLNELVSSMQRDGFQFNSDNGGVDDLNLIRDQYLKQQYTAAGGSGSVTPQPGRGVAPLEGIVGDVLDQIRNGTYTEPYAPGDINDPNAPRGQSPLTKYGTRVQQYFRGQVQEMRDFFHVRPTNE